MKKVKILFSKFLFLIGLLVFNFGEQMNANKGVANVGNTRKNALDIYENMLNAADDNDFESFENLARQLPPQFMAKLKQGIGNSGATIPGNPKASSFVAQFDLKITRTKAPAGAGAKIDVPVMLFNPLNMYNEYINLLALPAGSSYKSIAMVGNVLRFTVTDGVDTDYIDIEGTTSPYRSFLFALMFAEFNINKMRLVGTTATYAQFFSTSMQTSKRSLFGKISEQDFIPFQSQKSPLQYDKEMLDLDVNLHFQNDKGLIYIMPQIYGVPLVISVFVNSFIAK